MLINMVKSKVSKSKWMKQQRVPVSENVPNWHSSVNLSCLWWGMCRHQCWSLLQCLLTKWCSQFLGDVTRHCALTIHAYWNNHLLWAVPYITGTLKAHIIRASSYGEATPSKWQCLATQNCCDKCKELTLFFTNLALSLSQTKEHEDNH
jgi:hypothetical protein